MTENRSRHHPTSARGQNSAPPFNPALALSAIAWLPPCDGHPTVVSAIEKSRQLAFYRLRRRKDAAATGKAANGSNQYELIELAKRRFDISGKVDESDRVVACIANQLGLGCEEDLGCDGKEEVEGSGGGKEEDDPCGGEEKEENPCGGEEKEENPCGGEEKEGCPCCGKEEHPGGIKEEE